MAEEERPPTSPSSPSHNEREFVPFNPFYEKEEDAQEDREIFPAGASPIMYSISSDCTLRHWNLKAGTCDREQVGHKGACMCMEVDWVGGRSQLRDAQRLVLTGSADFTIMKWEAKRVLWLSTYEGHTGTVSGLSVDWEEKRFASSSYDGTVKIWDLEDADAGCTQTLEGKHEGPVCCLAVDWETGCVMTGSEDTDLMQWDLEAGEMVMSVEGHTGPVWQVSMDPESMRLISCGKDRTVKLWDLRSGEMIRSMLKHTLPVGVMEVDWASGRCMTGSSDRSIILWDFEAGEDLCKLEGHFGGVWALSVDWRGNRCVSGAGPCDNGIRLWDFDSERGIYCAENLQVHQQTVWDLKVDWEACFWEKPESDEDEDEVAARRYEAKMQERRASQELDPGALDGVS